MSTLMQKPYTVRFKADPFLFTSMYLCYFNKIPLDLLIAMHEKFGKFSIFFFKALACKGYIRVTDSQFHKIIDYCTLLCKQIKQGEIKRKGIDPKTGKEIALFDEKMCRFIDYLLECTQGKVYDYEIRFWFDLETFYGG